MEGVLDGCPPESADSHSNSSMIQFRRTGSGVSRWKHRSASRQRREPVKPFMSSTFKDMRAERKYLRERIFPQLRQIAQREGGDFSPIDLQWGVSSAEASRGKVLYNCLHYINSTRPHFMCLLGERYGSFRPPREEGEEAPEHWMDKHYAYAKQHGENEGLGWTDDPAYKHVSITEIEIRQACFDFERGSFTREKCRNAFVYMGTPERVQKIVDELAAKDPTADRAELEEVYVEQSEYGRAQLQRLKGQIQENLQVRYFSTCEELGEMVTRDWTAVLREQGMSVGRGLPSSSIECWYPADELFREWQHHEAYAAVRGDPRGYVETDETKQLRVLLDCHAQTAITGMRAGDTLRQLVGRLQQQAGLDTAAKKCGQILVLRTQAGTPGSRLLASWSQALRHRHPGLCLVTHFVEAELTSRRPNQFGSWDVGAAKTLLRRVVAELRSYHVGQEPRAGMNELKRMQWLCTQLASAINLGPCVVMIDKIDQVLRESSHPGVDDHFTGLDWLPPDGQLSLGSQLILRVDQDEDPLFQSLRERKDTTVIELKRMGNQDDSPAEAARRKVQRHDVLVQLLAYHCKQLDPEQIDLIVNSPLSWSYSTLVLILDELRMASAHSVKLTSVIQNYLYEEDGTDRSMASVYTQVLARWKELDAIVEDALKLIYTSRNGLSESDLLRLLSYRAHAEDPDTLRGRWAFFRIQASDNLYMRADSLIDFASPNLRDAVAGLFQEEAEYQKFHRILAEYLTDCEKTPAQASELLWNLERCGAPKCEMTRYATTRDIFENMQTHYQQELSSFWSRLTKDKAEVVTAHRRMLQEVGEQGGGGVMLGELWSLVGELFISRSCFTDALEVLEGALERAAQNDDLPHLARDVHNQLAKLFHFLMNEPMALKHYKMALQLNQRCVLVNNRKDANWVALTNLEIAHLALISNSNTFNRSIDEDTRIVEVKQLLQSAKEIHAKEPDSRQVLGTRILHVEAILSGTEAGYLKCIHAGNDPCEHCAKLHKQKELYTLELEQLLRLYGAQHELTASVQNALGGICCRQCLQSTHQMRCDVDACKGKRDKNRMRKNRSATSLALLTPTSSGSSDFGGLFDAASPEQPAPRLEWIKEGWNSSVCTECGPERQALYDKALSTRMKLQGETGCLVATTLFHLAKLKMNMHDLLVSHKEPTDLLYQALPLLEESIKLRSEAFEDLGADDSGPGVSARFLVTAVQKRYGQALMKAGACKTWIASILPDNEEMNKAVFRNAYFTRRECDPERCPRTHGHPVGKPKSAEALKASAIEKKKQLERSASTPAPQATDAAPASAADVVPAPPKDEPVQDAHSQVSQPSIKGVKAGPSWFGVLLAAVFVIVVAVLATLALNFVASLLSAIGIFNTPSRDL
eukprot:TRINITY_DN12064_c0_g1_i1.p1 TRINITY_DN12064_c0_g1~~TRINITY_DN12064_c0_g1_i1.p1  ORF type:complete len:1379 (-),score=335.65 TRINITY_DN12064_c0_g1_i1:81-4217(-)